MKYYNIILILLFYKLGSLFFLIFLISSSLLDSFLEYSGFRKAFCRSLATTSIEVRMAAYVVPIPYSFQFRRTIYGSFELVAT